LPGHEEDQDGIVTELEDEDEEDNSSVSSFVSMSINGNEAARNLQNNYQQDIEAASTTLCVHLTVDLLVVNDSGLTTSWSHSLIAIGATTPKLIKQGSLRTAKNSHENCCTSYLKLTVLFHYKLSRAL
jgi:uncharacterized UBP type Zn finger protein